MQQGLPDDSQAIIGQLLTAAANGPYFPEWEFHTLFGLERTQVRDVATRWPDVDQDDPDVKLAIKASLINLTGYPRGMSEKLEQEVGVSEDRIDEVYLKWRSNQAG